MVSSPHTSPATAEGFAVHQIDDTQSETAAVADLNNDGRLDIIAAEYWYEAPGWTKHPLRTIQRASGYVDDFSDLPIDVDGDGYIDIVQDAYFARRLEWLKNPGKSGSSWTVNLIDAVGPTEFAFLVDLNNDGKPLELLPQFTRAANQPATWYEVVNGAWVKHTVSDAKFFGHGIGAGDLNRDGRADIITPTGWLEAARDPRAPGNWTFHDTNWAQLGTTCAQDPAAAAPAPPSRGPAGPALAEFGYMYVRDINNDGRPDILTTMGHSCGVLWLEAPADQNGAWSRHVIDDSWSAAHAATLIDMNADGRPDLVTGKRAQIHSDAAPTERDRLSMYWYEFPRSPSASWTRHVIEEGGKMGGGLQIAVVDLDKDGDLDIVSGGKTGLFVAENRTRSLSVFREPEQRNDAVERRVTNQLVPRVPAPGARLGSYTADLYDAKFATVGKARFTPARDGGVNIALDITSLPPGEHGVHLHAVPSCGGTNFADAGGHFNPTNMKHGLQNPEGHHAGDMDNFTVNADGTAKVTLTVKGVTLGGGGVNSLANGAALVIHAKADDMKTDPSGNSGDRIACTVIVKW